MTVTVTVIEPSIERHETRIIRALVLCGVLAIAVVARLHYADADPSYDEWWHMALSVGRGTPFGAFVRDQVYLRPQSQVTTTGAPPWWNVWTHMTGVLHPPLYCLTLRWWRDALGDSIAVARAYTLAWSLVAIAFTFATARITMGLFVASFVGVAMAIAPTQVYLGQEVRGYAMLLGLAAIALWWMTRIEMLGSSRCRAIVLGLLPLPLLLTHYFAFGAAVAIALFGAMRLVGHRRAFVVALVTSATIYAVAWLPFAVRQLGDLPSGDAFLHVAHRDPIASIVLVATAPFRLLADRDVAIAPYCVLFAALFVLPWMLKVRFRPLLPWTLWLACGVAPLFVLDMARSTNHLGYARYLTVATPAVFLLVVGCGYAIRRLFAPFAAIALAALCAIQFRSGTWMAYEIPPNTEPVHLLGRLSKPGEGLIVYRGHYVDPMLGPIILLQCSVEPGLFPRPIVEISGPMSPGLVEKLPRRSWLVSAPFDGPVDRLIPGARVLGSAQTHVDITLTYLELDAGTPLDSPPPAATMPAEHKIEAK